MTTGFLDNLVIEEMSVPEIDGAGLNPDTAWSQLQKQLRYSTGNLLFPVITVPQWFITDFASVPRIFWNLLSPDDPHYVRAAVLHDYLYNQHVLEKEMCDRIFRDAMVSLGVNKVTVWILYHAVKWFGGHAYNSEKPQKMQEVA